jgi:hypothetical protein
MDKNKKDDESRIYRIKLEGCLDVEWSNWFDGFSINYEGEDTTILTGEIIDDAAMHGVLKKIRDLGITLLSINLQEE